MGTKKQIKATNEIKIESGIPLPTAKWEKFPFNKMKVGDSFFIKDRSLLNNSIIKYKRQCRLNGLGEVKFMTKTEGEGYRVWRVK